MLNEKEVIKWQSFLISELHRLHAKGYQHSDKYKQYDAQINIIELILDNQRVEEE